MPPNAPVDNVIEVFQKWLYLPKPEALLAVLGTVAANQIEGDPVWLLVVGPPGGGKSEMLQAILGVANTYPAATMTERALLSGTAKKEREDGAKGGLLREIGAFGILVCKDFGSILSMNRDERARTLAALREVYDGSWTRHVGVDGGKTLHWEGKVGVIAGSTPAIDAHHAVMGAMGERFVLLRLPVADDNAQARKALEHLGHEAEMRAELRDAVTQLFRKARISEATLTESERVRLIALARLVARCRSSVERDSYNREIELVPGSEAPTRLIIVLANVLKGLNAIGVDRARAWDVVAQIALDSMPRLRHDVLLTLYDDPDQPSTSDVAELVRHPTQTTRRALEDLTAHYVVERHPQGKGKADLWNLSDWAQKALHQAISDTVPEMSDPKEPEGVPETLDHHKNNHQSDSLSSTSACRTTIRERSPESQNGAVQERLVTVPEDAGPPDEEDDVPF